MPLGTGFWFDRRKRRYHRIDEHAQDAIGHPGKFRSQPVAHLDPVRDRDVIVIFVSQQGFIRIRHHRGHLGWQFWGEPNDALDDLRRFCTKYEVGPATIVTATDFSTKLSVTASLASFAPTLSAFDVGLALTDENPHPDIVTTNNRSRA